MRKIIAAVSSAAVLLLAGCSGGDLRRRAYLRAVAVENDRAALSFFDDTEPLTVECGSLSEALEAAELRCGMEIFTGYTELIILGDCSGESVLSELLTGWRVSPECIVAKSLGSACSVLTGSSAELISGSVKRAADKGEAPESGIVTVLSGLLSSKNTAELPVVGTAGAVSQQIISGD